MLFSMDVINSPDTFGFYFLMWWDMIPRCCGLVAITMSTATLLHLVMYYHIARYICYLRV